MITKASSLLLILFYFSVAGCSDVNVKTDVAGKNFDSYKSYSWHKDAVHSKPGIDSLVHDDVIRLVDVHLEKKGYSHSGTPGFIVNYQVTAEDTFDIKTLNVYSGYGPGFVWRAGEGVSNEVMVSGHEIQIQELRKGTLVIDVIDANTDKLVWRGTADKKIEGRLTSGERRAVLKTAIAQLLRGIPAAIKR